MTANHKETLQIYEDTTYRIKGESSSIKIKIFKDFFCFYSNARSPVRIWTSYITVCMYTMPLYALPFTEQKYPTQQKMASIGIQQLLINFNLESKTIPEKFKLYLKNLNLKN